MSNWGLKLYSAALTSGLLLSFCYSVGGQQFSQICILWYAHGRMCLGLSNKCYYINMTVTLHLLLYLLHSHHWYDMYCYNKAVHKKLPQKVGNTIWLFSFDSLCRYQHTTLNLSTIKTHVHLYSQYPVRNPGWVFSKQVYGVIWALKLWLNLY